MSAAVSLRTAWVPTPDEAEVDFERASFKAKHALQMAEDCAAMQEHWRERAEHWLAEADRWANVAILEAARQAHKVADRRHVHIVSQGAKR